MTIPERRDSPFRIYVDSAMGATLEDCHGRLFCVFCFHPDGKPATDEAQRVMDALHYAEVMNPQMKIVDVAGTIDV